MLTGWVGDASLGPCGILPLCQGWGWGAVLLWTCEHSPILSGESGEATFIPSDQVRKKSNFFTLHNIPYGVVNK